MMLCGAEIALDYVGQRDTKWLTPLTVSDGYQGEEDNRHNIRRYRQSHGCSAFYFDFLTQDVSPLRRGDFKKLAHFFSPPNNRR